MHRTRRSLWVYTLLDIRRAGVAALVSRPYRRRGRPGRAARRNPTAGARTRSGAPAGRGAASPGWVHVCSDATEVGPDEQRRERSSDAPPPDPGCVEAAALSSRPRTHIDVHSGFAVA